MHRPTALSLLVLLGCSPDRAYLQVKDATDVTVSAYTPKGDATILPPGNAEANLAYEYACVPYVKGNSPIRHGTVRRFFEHSIRVNEQPLLRGDGALESKDKPGDVAPREGALLAGPFTIADGNLYVKVIVSRQWSCLTVTLVTPVANVLTLRVARD